MAFIMYDYLSLTPGRLMLRADTLPLDSRTQRIHSAVQNTAQAPAALNGLLRSINIPGAKKLLMLQIFVQTKHLFNVVLLFVLVC